MKQCPKCNTQCDDTKIYCPNCGNLLKAVIEPMPHDDAKESNAGRVVVTILLVVSLIGNAILAIGWSNSSEEADRNYSRYWSMKSEYDSLQSEYDSLQSNYNEIKDSYDFYDEHARVVPSDGSKKYHKYGCTYLDTSSFQIHNTKYITANNLASPCPYCCPDD